MKKSMLAVLLVALLAMGLTACAKASTLGLETIEETGAFKVTAENAIEKQSASSSFSLKEGQVLMISPVLESGKIKVVLANASTDAGVFEQAVDGKVLSTYDVAPGEYKITVSGVNGATGTVVIAAVDKAEWDAQDAALVEALERNGIDPSVLPQGK